MADDWVTPQAHEDDWTTPGAAPAAPERTSQALGFEQGVGNFLGNAADLAGHIPGVKPAFQYLTGHTLDESTAALRNPAHAPNEVPGAWGRFGADMLETAPVALGTSAYPIMGSLATGAAAGYLTGDSDHPLISTALGAGFGGAGYAIGQGAKAVTRPIAQSPAVQKLLKEGVKLTPGQVIGGAAQRIEDAFSSVPFVGDAINNAKNRATESFNIAAVNRALAPINATIAKGAKVGRNMVDQAYGTIGRAYDTLLPQMTGVADQKLAQDFNDIGHSAIGEGVKQDVLNRFNNILDAQIKQRAVPLQTGPGIVPHGQQPPMGFTGQSLKDAQSNLGRIGRQLMSSKDADDRQLGSMVMDAHGAFNDMLARANPAQAASLSKINNAYAQMARVIRASSAQGADDGVFTAKQFSGAVKALDKSANKNAYARGKAMMQDLSDAGRQVLPSTIGDSGTFTRAAHLSPTALATGYLASLPARAIYNEPIQQGIVNALTAQRPAAFQTLGNLAGRSSPYLGAGATALVNSLATAPAYSGP